LSRTGVQYINWGRIAKRAKTFENEIFSGTAEVELRQVVNKIMKRESYQLEAVQSVCASTGIGTSLNRFYDGPPSRVLPEKFRLGEPGRVIHFKPINPRKLPVVFSWSFNL
jgi:hypothetical protein